MFILQGYINHSVLGGAASGGGKESGEDIGFQLGGKSSQRFWISFVKT